MAVRIGEVKRVPKNLYYVSGDGSVFRMPMGGGAKTKVAKFTRPDGSLCWVDGKGAVLCRKR